MYGTNNMKNLNESEKSNGVVVFAFNTDSIDYVRIADQTSKLIEKNLGLPVTLITDKNSEPKFKYHNIIRINNDHNDNVRTIDNVQYLWRNKGRYLAYELSPYDKTLLLDTDYLVLDSSLKDIFTLEFDYKIMQESTMASGNFPRSMGSLSHDWLWATVVFFTKSQKAELLFTLVKRIQENYGYYRSLFHISSNFRNDFAFAMADIILNGYATDCKNYLPYKMFTVTEKLKNLEIKNNSIVIRQDTKADVSPIQNLHIIDKEFLLTENFQQFVEHVTA